MEDKGHFSWLMELLSGLYGASGERSGARNPTAPFTRGWTRSLSKGSKVKGFPFLHTFLRNGIRSSGIGSW